MSVLNLFKGCRRGVLFPIPLLLGFLFLPQTSLAFENPQRYYDWGPSDIRVNQKVLGASISAETQSSSSAAVNSYEINNFKGYILGFGANFSPGNPFYFVKTLQESAALALTFNPTKREEIRLEIAGERLKELEDLAQGGKVSELNQTSHSYNQALSTVAENLDGLRKDNPDAEKLLSQFEEETAKHSLILEGVSLKVPEAAKAGLDRALVASHKVLDEASDLSGKPALPIDVLDRVQALKAQGLLSEEEAQKIISIKTRVEVREELNKSAKEGIFPEADIVKLNEVGKDKFEEEFNKIVELKKFLELKRLEEEKPDDETIKKVQEFAKNYKAGELIPSDLRQYWLPLVRLEELQNTIRPDIIDSKLLESNKDYLNKYNELVERIKPRLEDIEQLRKLAAQNPNIYVDPFYERLRGLAEKFGTTESQTRIPGSPPENKSCPSNSHWASVPYMPDGGYCVPNITYPTYGSSSTDAEGKTLAENRESICPEKYHRNYPGGPCLSDTYSGPRASYATYTPGYFPSPVFGPVACPNGYFWSGTTCLDSSRSCGGGSHWDDSSKTCIADTRPYSLQCGPGEYSGPNGVCTATGKSAEAGECVNSRKFWTGRECLDKAPEGGAGVACPQGQVWDNQNKGCSSGGYSGVPNPSMGNCRTPGECYDWCKANPGKCQGFDSNSSRPSDNQPMIPSRESQEAACRAGGGTCVSWVNGACGCEYVSGGNVGTGNSDCPAGQWWDRGTNTCRSSCPYGSSWNGRYCMTDSPSYTGSGGTGMSCPQGQFVGPGGYCVSPYSGNTGGYSSSAESQEAACRAGGGTCVSWVNGACGCERSGTSGTSGSGGYDTYTGTTPPSGYGSCSSGQYWNGSSCVNNTYTPPSSSESPEQACLRGTGCSWTGSACNCSPSSTTTSPSPTPTTTETTSPTPTTDTTTTTSPTPTTTETTSPTPTPTP